MKSLTCTINTFILEKNLHELDFPIFMVKADCYGHGMGLIPYAEKYVTAFGTATEVEAIEIRRKTKKPILVTSPNAYNASLYARYALTPLVGSVELARKIVFFDKTTRMHIKVDCGMGRFGFNNLEETEDFCTFAKGAGLSVKGIGSHIPSYECKDACKRRFEGFIKVVEGRFGRLLRHIEASSTSNDKDFDVQRIGLKAYRNVMTLESHVAYVKKINRGDTVGYDNIFVAMCDELIAVVYGGYADGIPRSAIGYEVSINGFRSPIIAVCMDVFIVRLTEKCNVGDRVEIISSFSDIENLSGIANRIPYEIFTGIGRRCGFVYKE